MKKIYLLFFTLLITGLSFGQTVFINEIHYDDLDGDSDEGFEIAGPVGTDLSSYVVELYNGSNGTFYGASPIALSGTITDQQNGYGTIWFGLPTNGMQNGSPDGLALIAPDGTTVIQFLSYEGQVTATNGVANGMTSTDIGVTENNATPNGQSLQLTGTGTTYSDFVWASPVASTHDAVNTGQTFGTITNTIVEFVSTTNSTSEGVGTIDVCVAITNPDGSNATSVDIAMNMSSTTTNGSDFTMITFVHTLTFAAGSSTNECLTFTITDDMDVEIPEDIILDLENATGGNSVALGTNIQHTLTIEASDMEVPAVGAIIVSEIMQNPTTVPDSDGEYFEVYNTTGVAIDMEAWTITDNGGQLHNITTSLVVPAGGYIVLGASTNTGTNGDVPVDYAYGFDIGLSNGDDEIILTAGTTEIDRVEYNDIDFPDGSNIESASMNLNIGNLNGTDNDTGANWCISISDIGTAGNLDNGTPGAMNDDCSTSCGIILTASSITCNSTVAGDNNDSVTINIPYTGVDAAITSVTTTSGGTVEGDDPASVSDGTITITGLSEGDAWDITINGGNCDGTTDSGTVDSAFCDPILLVINEILHDPAPGADPNGDGTANTSQDEFVEIYNMGTSSIDMTGFMIEDGASSPLRHTFPASTILPANSFITVFGAGTPTGISGMTQIATSGALGFNNGGDTVTLKNASGGIIDTHTYGSGTVDQSFAREPDFTGGFVAHLSHATNPIQYSPGAKNDGTALSVVRDNIEGFAIYPNPVNNGEFSINSISNASKQVQIFDMLGKQVYSNEVQANENVTVSNLNSGIYILRVLEEGKTATRKLVIQ